MTEGGLYHCIKCDVHWVESEGEKSFLNHPPLLNEGEGVSTSYCGRECYEHDLRHEWKLPEKDITELLKNYDKKE